MIITGKEAAERLGLLASEIAMVEEVDWVPEFTARLTLSGERDSTVTVTFSYNPNDWHRHS